MEIEHNIRREKRNLESFYNFTIKQLEDLLEREAWL